MSKEVNEILATIANNFIILQEALKEQQSAVDCDIKNLQLEVERNRNAIRAAANAMINAIE